MTDLSWLPDSKISILLDEYDRGVLPVYDIITLIKAAYEKYEAERQAKLAEQKPVGWVIREDNVIFTDIQPTEADAWSCFNDMTWYDKTKIKPITQALYAHPVEVKRCKSLEAAKKLIYELIRRKQFNDANNIRSETIKFIADIIESKCGGEIEVK